MPDNSCKTEQTSRVSKIHHEIIRKIHLSISCIVVKNILNMLPRHTHSLYGCQQQVEPPCWNPVQTVTSLPVSPLLLLVHFTGFWLLIGWINGGMCATYCGLA
jgi:hypothetical protein